MGEFRKGDRVKFVGPASTFMRPTASKTGVVVGFGRRYGQLRIIRDGLKNRETWTPKYWAKDMETVH